MVHETPLQVLRRGRRAWTTWRRANPGNSPDLTNADLAGENLVKKDLYRANLTGANLHHAKLFKANLGEANLTGANLGEADLRGAYFYKANLSKANLAGADLSRALVVQTSLEKADLSGCRIYGISAWDVAVDADTRQSELIITPSKQPTLTVDNLEVAQFVYLLLYNDKIRQVIDTITSKVVLILGRFTAERKAVLDAIRDKLRRRNLTPILFDFATPASKDATGTIETLARMARFIIADVSDPRSVPHELATIVPLLRTTPVLPLQLKGSEGYSMFSDMRAYPWVLPTHEYANARSLISTLPDVIKRADIMANNYRIARP